MSKPIVTIGNPVLRQKTSPVTEFNDILVNLVKDMEIAMRAAKGIGLAANQIGVSESVCIIDVSTERKEVDVFINPEITKMEDPVKFDEACLSIPGVSERTDRFNKVTVRYQKLDGSCVEENLEGIKAIAMQHEVDHLNGKLYVDQLSRLKKQLLAKKYQKVRTTG